MSDAESAGNPMNQGLRSRSPGDWCAPGSLSSPDDSSHIQRGQGHLGHDLLGSCHLWSVCQGLGTSQLLQNVSCVLSDLIFTEVLNAKQVLDSHFSDGEIGALRD